MSSTARTPATEPQVSILLTSVFLVYLGQMTLNPIIAPLSREVGLAEWQVGFTVSVAAIMVVATSQFWGRRSQSWGRKPVLVAAFTIATIAMALFAGLAQLGMAGIITGATLFVLFVSLRGLLFGSAISAVAPTAQAFIADITTDEPARVKGMAQVGAVQGIAMVAGAVVGGVLSTFGLSIPLIAVPVLLAGGLVLIVTKLRKEPSTSLIEQPAHVKPTDPRVWPYLAAAFGMYTAMGFVQVITGFLVQDRFELDSAATGLFTGGALLIAGVGMVLAQSIVVPRSQWSPVTLLRVGGITTLMGFLILIPHWGHVLFAISMLFIGIGMGIAMPGITAGPTLSMRREEQGALAGLVGATNGLTFVIAPTAGTALYGIWGPLPVIVGACILTVVTIFVLVHPRFRTMSTAMNPAAEPAPVDR